jgi:hypothetical protein
MGICGREVITGSEPPGPRDPIHVQIGEMIGTGKPSFWWVGEGHRFAGESVIQHVHEFAGLAASHGGGTWFEGGEK